MPQEKPTPRRRIEEPQKHHRVNVEREPVKRTGTGGGEPGGQKKSPQGQPRRGGSSGQREPMRRGGTGGTGTGTGGAQREPMRRGVGNVEREPRRGQPGRNIDIEREPREEKGANIDVERE